MTLTRELVGQKGTRSLTGLKKKVGESFRRGPVGTIINSANLGEKNFGTVFSQNQRIIRRTLGLALGKTYKELSVMFLYIGPGS